MNIPLDGPDRRALAAAKAYCLCHQQTKFAAVDNRMIVVRDGAIIHEVELGEREFGAEVMDEWLEANT
jgi:hypothetical protein